MSKNKASDPNPDEFIENLGPDKLTCLGRIDAARVLVDSLGIHRDSLKTGYSLAYFPFFLLQHFNDSQFPLIIII